MKLKESKNGSRSTIRCHSEREMAGDCILLASFLSGLIRAIDLMADNMIPVFSSSDASKAHSKICIAIVVLKVQDEINAAPGLSSSIDLFAVTASTSEDSRRRESRERQRYAGVRYIVWPLIAFLHLPGQEIKPRTVDVVSWLCSHAEEDRQHPTI
jgi:hypothetical protein